jgi:hypothetical protein
MKNCKNCYFNTVMTCTLHNPLMRIREDMSCLHWFKKEGDILPQFMATWYPRWKKGIPTNNGKYLVCTRDMFLVVIKVLDSAYKLSWNGEPFDKKFIRFYSEIPRPKGSW